MRQLLGSPDGTGSLLFPAQNEIREIWFYERLQVTEKSGALEIEQDVLLMFFHGDVYDGFMWFSDADRPDSGAGAGP
ncbi:MAG: hypothetical protein JSV80_18290 [Acidobacteriota bacterium]|nr:MAG: hypothetical protein JSV80_18290 [Acidobacteriota bacterium]